MDFQDRELHKGGGQDEQDLDAASGSMRRIYDTRTAYDENDDEVIQDQPGGIGARHGEAVCITNFKPINFQDVANQLLGLLYLEALQVYTRQITSRSLRIKSDPRDSELMQFAPGGKRVLEKEFSHHIRGLHYRIGEASNPGPKEHQKQKKISDYINYNQAEKDAKSIWCEEKGYRIENIAGDGNCLYTCLGKSKRIDGNRVRQIMRDNADRLWAEVMKHDEASEDLEEFKNKTMDRTIWGQFEQIIIWSRIYQIRIEVYSHSMTTQIINGDEYNIKNDCIRLLHCNKSKWGDVENHYDLLHELPRPICNNKSYERRTEGQQAEYDEKKKRIATNSFWQTKIGEDKKINFINRESKTWGNEQDKNTQNDMYASNKPPKHIKNGRMYKEEK